VVEEAGVSGEIHRPAASGWQALYLYTFVYVCTMPSMAPVKSETFIILAYDIWLPL
jgi:hypothetical protein